jgi:ribosome-associated protein
VQLRFDIRASVLPEDWKQRLLAKRDHRITEDGLVVIKSQQFRSQEMNREAAIERLRVLLLSVSVAPKARKATRPTAASKRKRLESKQRQGRIKALRSSKGDD